MNGVRSLSPAHTRSPMWVMLKIFIYNFLQTLQVCGKVQFERPFFSRISFVDYENGWIGKFYF